MVKPVDRFVDKSPKNLHANDICDSGEAAGRRGLITEQTAHEVEGRKGWGEIGEHIYEWGREVTVGAEALQEIDK